MGIQRERSLKTIFLNGVFTTDLLRGIGYLYRNRMMPRCRDHLSQKSLFSGGLPELERLVLCMRHFLIAGHLLTNKDDGLMDTLGMQMCYSTILMVVPFQSPVCSRSLTGTVARYKLKAGQLTGDLDVFSSRVMWIQKLGMLTRWTPIEMLSSEDLMLLSIFRLTTT